MASGTWGTLGEPDPEAGAARLMHVAGTSAVTLRHAFYEKGAKVARHRHEHATLVYGVGGPCLEHTTQGQLIKRRLIFHPPGFSHALEFCGAAHVITIEIDAAALGVDEASFPSESMPLIAPLYNDVWRALVRLADGGDSEKAREAIEEAAREAVGFIRRRKPEWVMEVVDQLHRQWKTVPSAAALGAQFSVSPQYLCRAFKKCIGVTIQQYALLLRLDYARGLLWGTRMPISEVAAETGFADQSHLTRALTLYSGKTPSRLRWMGRGASGEELAEDGALEDEEDLLARRH